MSLAAKATGNPVVVKVNAVITGTRKVCVIVRPLGTGAACTIAARFPRGREGKHGGDRKSRAGRKTHGKA